MHKTPAHKHTHTFLGVSSHLYMAMRGGAGKAAIAPSIPPAQPATRDSATSCPRVTRSPSDAALTLARPPPSKNAHHASHARAGTLPLPSSGCCCGRSPFTSPPPPTDPGARSSSAASPSSLGPAAGGSSAAPFALSASPLRADTSSTSRFASGAHASMSFASSSATSALAPSAGTATYAAAEACTPPPAGVDSELRGAFHARASLGTTCVAT